MSYWDLFQESKLSSSKRDNLKDSDFGIPEKRAYPLHDKAHIEAAVRMFPHADAKDKKELARRILMKAHKLGMDTSGWKSLQEYVQESATDTKDMATELDDIKEIYRKASQFSYGFLVNDRPETDQTKFTLPYMVKYYKTMSIDQIEQHKLGICFDHTYYIANELNSKKIKYKTFFIVIAHPVLDITLAHVFNVAFPKDGSKCVYIETAASGNDNGVFPSTEGAVIALPIKTLLKILKSILSKEKLTKKLVNMNNWRIDVLDVTDKLPSAGMKYASVFKHLYKHGKYIRNGHAKMTLDKTVFASKALNVVKPVQESAEGSSMIKVDDFPYDKVYFGSPTKYDGKMDLTRPLFVTPFKGLASIFAAAHNRDAMRYPKGHYNLGYDEWGLPDDQLNEYFDTIHIRIEGMPEVPEYEVDATGYVHEIDISDLKENIYRYPWMNEREALIGIVDHVDCVPTEVTVHCIIKGTEKKVMEGYTMARSPEAFLKKQRMLFMEDGEQENTNTESSSENKDDELDMPIPEYMKERLGIEDDDELEQKDDVTYSPADETTSTDTDESMSEFEIPEEDNGETAPTTETEDTSTESNTEDSSDTEQESKPMPSRFSSNDESSTSKESNSDDGLEGAKIDFQNFGKDNSDIQNEYDEDEVRMLNELIADEQYSIGRYFDGAKNTNDETLRRLYADIGAEESFHAEQLMFAKATLTGEEYTPRNPDIRKEYEELKSMGMDDESAMYTAADKFNLWGGNDALNNSDMSELAQEAAIIYESALQAEILSELYFESVQYPNKNDRALMIMESYYMEEVVNPVAQRKDMGGTQDFSLIRFIDKILRTVVDMGQRMGETINNAYKSGQIRANIIKRNIQKYGPLYFLKQGLHLYFYDAEHDIVDLTTPYLYTDLLYRLTDRICKDCRIQNNLEKSLAGKLSGKFKEAIRKVKNNETLIEFSDARLKPYQFQNVDQGVALANGAKFEKSPVPVNDNNKDMLASLLFGYTESKVTYQKDGKTVTASKNFNTTLECLNILTTSYAKFAQDTLKEITSLQGQMNTVYYSNRKLYDAALKYLRQIAQDLQKLTTATAHDLKEYLRLNKAVGDIKAETEAHDAADVAGEKYEGQTRRFNSALGNPDKDSTVGRMSPAKNAVQDAKEKGKNFIDKAKETISNIGNKQNKG